MSIDHTIVNSRFDEVAYHLAFVNPDYREVFIQRNPTDKVTAYIESNSQEQFLFLDEDHFSRCGKISVIFLYPDIQNKPVKLGEKEALEAHLKTVSDGDKRTQMLTEFFLSQDGYFWPVGQVAMELQKRGFPANIDALPPESITVQSDPQNSRIIIGYVFRQAVKDMENTEDDPNGATIGTLVHEFGYIIDKESDKINHYSQNLYIDPLTPVIPFTLKIIEDFAKPVPLPGCVSV